MYIKNLIESKIEFLEQVESKIPNSKDGLITSIEPESFFSIIYILKFKRNDMNSKKYNISIESKYKESNNSLIGGASVSQIISPNPIVLSNIAIGFSILGTIVKISLEGGVSFVHKVNIANSVIWNDIFTYILQTFITSVIAVVFFNIYEYLDIGKKITLSVSWRSAMLIGFLSGLFADRILDSVKVFIGIA